MSDFQGKIEIDSGARFAIRLLRDAAERGDIDPWDVDVIPVVDGFLDQLRQRIDVPKKIAKQISSTGGSFEIDLAESSEAFLAASVLVSLKAEILESEIFPQELPEEEFMDISQQGWLDQNFDMPKRPESLLSRRPVAPPPLRRPVTLGELIQQLESIAESIESEKLNNRRKNRNKRFSDKQVIDQISSLAHKENLPETTAALGTYLSEWEDALHWIDFDLLVNHWGNKASEGLDTDRVGVFWALLFLSSQGKVELQQKGTLFSRLQLKRILGPGMVAQLPINSLEVSDNALAAA